MALEIGPFVAVEDGLGAAEDDDDDEDDDEDEDEDAGNATCPVLMASATLATIVVVRGWLQLLSSACHPGRGRMSS